MAITNDNIYDTAQRLVQTRKQGFTLIYPHYDDRLMTEQVEALVDGDFDKVYDEVGEAFADHRHHMASEDTEEVVKEAINDLMWDDEDGEDEDDLYWEFEYSDLFDEVRWLIMDRDDSNPVRNLAANTPDPLVQYVPEHPIEVGFDGDVDYDEDDVATALTDLGLFPTEHNQKVLREALDNCHAYATIRPIFTVDLTELLDPSVKEVRLKNPVLLALNPYDGSGMDSDPAQGTIAVPRDRIALDSALGYGSWDNIAGVVRSAYTVDTEYVRICEYTFEGTDTDGTDYYRCHHHGNLEPSPDVHCDGATEPAYGRLIEKED